MKTGFPVEQSEQAAKHNRELVVITSQSAHGGPDTASPEHASLFTSTRTAYPKTHPAATCKRPRRCWQHANTIVSSYENPHNLNRFSYVRNNPLRYIDPSGHRPIDDGCPGCKFPKYNDYTRKAQEYGDKSSGYMSTYVIAAIGVQNPHITRWYLPKGIGKYFSHTHLGVAKVSDTEMDTDYGVKIFDKKKSFRGYGLGMIGQDQTDPKVAVEAMTRRIQIVTSACDARCTSTDIFLVSALAQNGPGFNLDNMNILMHGKDYIPRPTGGTCSLDWGTYIISADTAKKIKLTSI